MTRDEEIREASIDYQLSTAPRAIGGDAFYDFVRESNVNQDFIAGAKWIEKQMIEKACTIYQNELKQFAQLLKIVSEKNTSGLIDIEKSVEEFKKAMEE